jgi:hypothetical protein
LFPFLQFRKFFFIMPKIIKQTDCDK